LISACKKDEIGGTTTQKIAGTWYVTASPLDLDGDVIGEDFWGIGHFLVDTYSTADNSITSIWIDDNGNFWDFKGKIQADVNSLTFSGTDVENISYEDSEFTIKNGKILLGAAKTPSGAVADSIYFTVSFNDEDDPDNVSGYKLAGYRYTGLAGDEDN
jgi:hypothetical protein